MADYTPRLKASYKDVVRPAMKEEFAYKNDMMIPKLTKITLNMGIGETVNDCDQMKSSLVQGPITWTALGGGWDGQLTPMLPR